MRRQRRYTLGAAPPAAPADAPLDPPSGDTPSAGFGAAVATSATARQRPQERVSGKRSPLGNGSFRNRGEDLIYRPQ